MKIQSLTGNWGYFGVVRERQDGESRGHAGYSGGQPRKESAKDPYSSQNFEEETPSQEKMNEAVRAFSEDAQTQQNGLSASLEGQGPGLKVILKDGSGKILRQLSGSEFIQLRSSNPTGAPAIGKILDRKL